MKNRGIHTFWTRAALGFVVPFLLGISACRLEDNKLQVKIYPENGATNVPVNTVIEIQYPSELGIAQDQMKPELFAIHECTVSTFDYLTPKKPADAEKNSSEPEKTSSDPKKDDDKEKSTEPEKSSDTGTKYLSKVNFFYANSFDAEKKIIFNYLVVDPGANSTPLKPSDDVPTTYCVRVKKLKNKNGEVVSQKEISFTTEDTSSLDFSSKIQPEFFGKRLAVTQKNADTGAVQRDFILINFRGQSVRPNDLKDKITLCLQPTEQSVQTSTSTEVCKNFGDKVAIDVYMLEGLLNEDGLVRSQYSLFAIAPRIVLTPDQKFQIVVNRDINKSEEANIGTSENIIEMDDDPTLNWHSAYKDDVKDSSGKPLYTPHHRFFYIGSGS